MDDKRFDLLTKSLSSGISRRSLLRSLAAGLGVAAIGAEQAVAAPGGVNGTKKCYGGGSQCTNGKQCCSGTCTNRVCAPEDPCATMNCNDGNPCTEDSCAAGSCTHTLVATGTPCPGGFCTSTGSCIPAVCTPGGSEACYSGPAGTEGVGICKAGTRTCDALGQWGSCTGEVLPTTEICGNNLDDDCDGLIDEGCGGQCQIDSDCGVEPCVKHVCIGGQCEVFNVDAGYELPSEYQTKGDCRLAICDGNGNQTWKPDDFDVWEDFLECTSNICTDGTPSNPPLAAGTPCGNGNLVCDGKGNCLPPGSCDPGSQQMCYSGPAGTAGVGICQAGIQICDAFGNWGGCAGEVLPMAEICFNGLDDDCDGQVDNGCGGECQSNSACGVTTPCVKHDCIGGFCQVSYAYPGAPLAPEYQIAGDCQTLICDGNGNIRSTPDDTDSSAATMCVTYSCFGGNVVKEIAPDGTVCGDGLVCNGGSCQ